MTRLVFGVACGLTWLVLRTVAAACSYSPPLAFEIRDDPEDTTPPAAPPVRVERIKRGRAPERDGCQYEATSCDDVGYILLDLDSAAGVDPAQHGYVIELQGDAPAELSRRRGPLSPSEDGTLRLVWDDGEGEAHYDFDVYVWSVDRAGNVSDEPTQLHVESGGAAGCAAASHASGGGLLATLLVLVCARRRAVRRATSECGATRTRG